MEKAYAYLEEKYRVVLLKFYFVVKQAKASPTHKELQYAKCMPLARSQNIFIFSFNAYSYKVTRNHELCI